MPTFPARAALLLTLTFTASLALAQPFNYSQGGYADKHSVASGETIAFHIASSMSPFDVEIVNMASQFTVLQKITGLSSQANDCTGKWENGCQWPVTTTFTVPSNFVPGYYAARFPTGAGTRHILFVVRAAVPGSYAPIAVIQPSYSDVAYNRFGGKSVYDTISDDGQRAHIVSFNRPYHEDTGLARYQIWESRFVAWMKAEGRKFEVITDHDMEAGIPLSGYKALLIVGHSEYWTLKGRQHLEAYSRSGGHVAIFGANTMWWQVRVDLQSRQMTVYKDAALDPLNGIDNDLVTTNFTEWPVLNPENFILGASFLNAAYVNKTSSGDRVPVAQRVPYTVRKADHWVFAGTGLSNGGTMGRSVAAVEVDGALFNTLPNGDVVVEGSDGTPLSLQILATLPASDGYATIGFHTNPQGGGVFNGAARDWSFGLASDPVIQKMTRNVLDRLATGEPFPYQPRVTPNRLEDLFNHPPTVPEFLPGWRYHRFGFNIVSRCAREGPTGLELAGPRWTQVLRNLAVGRNGLKKAAASIWINADSLVKSPNFATPLIAFIDYRGPSVPYAAALEIQDRPAGRSLRVSSFDGSAIVASTAWVVLNPGWQPVEFAWESPGLLELNVSGTEVSAVNPRADQKMNSVMLEFAGSFANGSVCVDHLQLRDAFVPPPTASSLSLTSAGTTLAGQPVTLVLEVNDADGQPAASYRGTVRFTSDSETAALPSDYTFTEADAGRHEFTATAPSSVGQWTVSVVDQSKPELADSFTIDVQGNTSTTLSSEPASSFAGQPVTFTASVTSEALGMVSGNVTFRAGASTIGTATVSDGVATLIIASLPEGTHSITAEYNGGGGFRGSTSNSVEHVVRASRFGAPTGLNAAAMSPTAVALSWLPVEGASHYELFRRDEDGGFEPLASTGATSFMDTTVTANRAYLYYARAISTGGAISGNSATEVATTVIFTDDPLVARETVVKAVHFMEVRTAINELRDTAGLPPVSFTDPTLTGKPFSHVHMQELRDALTAARAAAGLAAIPLTGPAPASRAPVRAIHLQELRDALK